MKKLLAFLILMLTVGLSPIASAEENFAELRFALADTNHDGMLSQEEYQSDAHDIDTNGDGVVDLDELLRVIQFYNTGGYDPCPYGEDGFVVVDNICGEPPLTYPVTTEAVPANAGTITGGGSFEAGTTQTLTAIPNVGWQFHHWTGPVASTTANPTTMIVPAGTSYVNAVFVTITGEGEGEGEGQTEGEGSAEGEGEPEGNPEGELDTEAPIITLNGNANITIEACSNYTELGATAIDEVDGSVAVELVVEGDVVDEYVPGTYAVNYTSRDSAGNTATATRTVNVVDTTAPITTLTGAATVDTMQGEVYDDPGASATDGCRGFSHITWETTGAVNTATPGVYTITYTATDDFDNSASVTRTVTVIEVGELAITSQTTSLSALENTAVELTVEATGSNLTFQWEASGNVAAPDIVWNPVTIGNWWGVSGMKTATLHFAGAQISSSMWYRCVVSDGTSTVTTKPIWLHVIDVFNGGGTTMNAIDINMEAQGDNLSITVDPPTNNPGQYFFNNSTTRLLFEFYFKDRDTVRSSVAFDGANPVNLVVPNVLAGTDGVLAFEMRGLVNEADDQGWISVAMQNFSLRSGASGIIRGDTRGNDNPDDYHWIFPKGVGKSTMSSLLDAILGVK